MKLLLDQGLPRSAVSYLLRVGIESVHVGEIGLATASDATILEFAREHGCVVVTLDADFHILLALSGASAPSVVRVRIEGQHAEQLTGLLVRVSEICRDDLVHGAMVSVTENGVRIWRLPLVR